MKPAPFAYHLAHDVAEAVALLAELGEDAKVLAGGQSLVPMMNLRLARPSALVDITRIPGLSYLQAGPGGLRIGTLTRHRAVETTRDPAVLRGFGVLPRSARWIGHYPIRARGTFGEPADGHARRGRPALCRAAARTYQHIIDAPRVARVPRVPRDPRLTGP